MAFANDAVADAFNQCIDGFPGRAVSVGMCRRYRTWSHRQFSSRDLLRARRLLGSTSGEQSPAMVMENWHYSDKLRNEFLVIYGGKQN
jgi:hypothetical protein